MYNIFNYIVNTPVVVGSVTYRPTIISCSWGLPELYVPSYIRNNINSLLSTATARGINICTATGDNGSNNGVGGTSTNADFPSSCPYLTAVGGTTLICPNFEYDTLTVETAWSSGGGAISRYFAKPTYQSDITATGRAVPDLALDADPATGVQFILQGQSVVYGGTSVAAPIFAGFLAAINANTFINPIIYNNPTNFNDIKSGSNGAYSAKNGYDFCTGLGSIKGGILGPKIISIPVIATGLSLKPSSVTLFTGQTTTIVATLAPPNTTNNILSWVSSDPTKVTVTNGVIRALSATTRPVTITVRTTDGSNKSATVSVIVNIAVQSISLNVATARVAVAKTVQLIATILPTSASNKAVTWSTTNSNVTVSNTGLVRGISAGTAIVRVTTLDGAKTASCTITIVIPVVSVSLNPSTLTLRVGSRSTIVLPANASNKAVSWSSSNTAIATVSSGGVVTGIRIGGPVNITVTTVDGGFTGRSVVTVN